VVNANYLLIVIDYPLCLKTAWPLCKQTVMHAEHECDVGGVDSIEDWSLVCQFTWQKPGHEEYLVGGYNFVGGITEMDFI